MPAEQLNIWEYVDGQGNATGAWNITFSGMPSNLNTLTLFPPDPDLPNPGNWPTARAFLHDVVQAWNNGSNNASAEVIGLFNDAAQPGIVTGTNMLDTLNAWMKDCNKVFFESSGVNELEIFSIARDSTVFRAAALTDDLVTLGEALLVVL